MIVTIQFFLLLVLASADFSFASFKAGQVVTSKFVLPKAPSFILQSRKKIESSEILKMKGGNAVAADNQGEVSPRDLKRNLLGLWGVVQVVSVLANAIKRLLPVAIQPFQRKDLSTEHWGLYVGFCLVMAYTEGYKAFQLKFSPMVVSRAFNLVQNSSILRILLAGPYSMGMFGASKKRMIVSWSITAGVFSLVKIVKYLPYPYRSIVDAGVVVGLSYGTLSILAYTVKALLGGKIVTDEDKIDPSKKE